MHDSWLNEILATLNAKVKTTLISVLLENLTTSVRKLNTNAGVGNEFSQGPHE